MTMFPRLKIFNGEQVRENTQTKNDYMQATNSSRPPVPFSDKSEDYSKMHSGYKMKRLESGH